MEISVVMTQLSSGIAAKSSSKDLEQDKMHSQRTQKKKIMTKTPTTKHQYALIFSNVEHLPLSVVFFNTLCITSILPKDFFLSISIFFFKASRIQINIPVAASNRTNILTLILYFDISQSSFSSTFLANHQLSNPILANLICPIRFLYFGARLLKK